MSVLNGVTFWLTRMPYPCIMVATNVLIYRFCITAAGDEVRKGLAAVKRVWRAQA